MLKLETTSTWSPAPKSLFIDKLFFAPEYQLSIVCEVERIPKTEDVVMAAVDGSQSVLETHSLETDTESTYDIQIQDFLKSEDRVLIVAGNTKSGKTGLIPRIREIAFDLGYFDTCIRMLKSSQKENVEKSSRNWRSWFSLQGKIFDFGSEEVDENYKKTIPIKVIRETELEASKEENYSLLMTVIL